MRTWRVGGPLTALLALAATAAPDTGHVPPPRHAQTAQQRQRMAALASRSVAASAAAEQQLLARLTSASLRSALQAVGAIGLAAAPGADLLQAWRAEAAAAEIAHGFDTRQNFDDVDLAHAASLEFFPNQWQLEIMFPRNLSDPATQQGRYGADGFVATVAGAAAAETSALLYGLANFSARPPSLPGSGPMPDPIAPHVPGGWPGSFDEASGRMVYGVLNSHRLDFPAPYWGNAAVVFNSSAVAPLLTLSPIDTGDFTAACPKVSLNFPDNFCGGWPASRCDFWQCRAEGGKCVADSGGGPANCSVWDGVLGTARGFDHILLPWADWHGRQADAVLALMLSRMLRSWWSAPSGASFYPNFTRSHGDFDYYHEANLVGTPLYKDGVVKFVLAQFAQHFGAPSGDGTPPLPTAMSAFLATLPVHAMVSVPRCTPGVFFHAAHTLGTLWKLIALMAPCLHVWGTGLRNWAAKHGCANYT